jgi:solute carrier family 25 carnitine/acylcarnitine transporter 20/29
MAANQNMFHSLIGGYASGVGLVACGHPFDTMKVLMQQGDTVSKETGKKTRPSLVKLVRQLWADHPSPAGFTRSLYAGATPPLVATGCINAVMFSSMALASGVVVSVADRNDGLRRLLTPAGANGAPKATDTRVQALSAVFVGPVLALFVAPMELVKAQCQVSHMRTGQRTTPRAVMRSLTFRQLFHGYSATAAARACNFAYFGGYAAARDTLARHTDSATLRTLAAGGFAGITYWLAAYPFDVVKNRMQGDNLAAPRYRSMFQTALAVSREPAGIRGFWAGFTPCLLRCFPANAAAFACYEVTMSALHRFT